MSEPLEFPPISKIRNFYHLTYFKARKEIFNNYIIFSNFVRTIVKADSTTDQEFEIKYGVFEVFSLFTFVKNILS